MSMNVGGSKGGAIADINVTPMADIMIVLLIIFMVITPMLQKGVDVKLPDGRQHQGAEGRAEDDHRGHQARTRTTYLNGIKVDEPRRAACRR